MPPAPAAPPAPTPPTVLVMPRRTGSEALADRLGEERALALEALLGERARAAAGAVGPREILTAGELGDGDLAAALAAAADRAWGAGTDRGPLVVLWPDLPRWRPDHLEAALSDLAAGCELALGPVFDGGFYLLALGRPLPGLLEMPAEAWLRPDAMAMILALAVKDQLQAGLLRAERALRTPADAAAALADPLLDDELREVLG